MAGWGACKRAYHEPYLRGIRTRRPCHSAPDRKTQKMPLRTACPLLEGERTYGGHREIDAIDPEPTPVFFDGSQAQLWLRNRKLACGDIPSSDSFLTIPIEELERIL